MRKLTFAFSPLLSLHSKMSLEARSVTYDLSVCTLIKAGEVRALKVKYELEQFRLVPYYMICACMYGRLEVLIWLLKVECPLEDDIYMPQVHSMFACHYGHFECFIYLKIAMVPLAPACLLFAHCINTYHGFGLGNVEILNYLLKMYDLLHHPKLKTLVVRKENVSEMLRLMQPQDVHLIVWLHSRLEDVSQVLTTNEKREQFEAAYNKELVEC